MTPRLTLMSLPTDTLTNPTNIIPEVSINPEYLKPLETHGPIEPTENYGLSTLEERRIPVKEPKNYVEERRTPVKEPKNYVEERRTPVEEPRNYVEERRTPVEEHRTLQNP